MRRRTLAIAAVVLAGAALLLFCCAGRDERTASAPAASSPEPPTTAAPETTTETPTATGKAVVGSTGPNGTTPSSSAVPPGEPSATPSATPTAAGAGSRIAQAVKSSDPRDLALLANIERELRRDPPPEVHALLAARQRGDSREALAVRIRALPELGVRVLAFRWLDDVLPAADAGTRQ